MTHSVLLGFICLLLLISLTGVSMAAESPGYALYVQGGVSSITNGTDGMTVITVMDVIPYFHITDGNKSLLLPIEGLTNITYPLDAAVVLSGTGNESTSLVKVSNLTLSDGNKSLILQVKPLEFYEGKLLNSFVSEKKELPLEKTGKFSSIGIYIETTQLPPANAGGLKITIINRSNDENKSNIAIFHKELQTD